MEKKNTNWTSKNGIECSIMKREQKRAFSNVFFFLLLQSLRCEDQIVLQYFWFACFCSIVPTSLGSSHQRQWCYFLIWFLLFTWRVFWSVGFQLTNSRFVVSRFNHSRRENMAGNAAKWNPITWLRFAFQVIATELLCECAAISKDLIDWARIVSLLQEKNR